MKTIKVKIVLKDGNHCYTVYHENRSYEWSLVGMQKFYDHLFPHELQEIVIIDGEF